MTARFHIAFLTLLLVALAASAPTAAIAQERTWELRVCADPNSMPFTNRAGEGFENQIAEILADEMGARLTYDWYPLTQDMITLRLREGLCDVIMGLPDGYAGVTTTLAYYRSPYVFIYRSDADFTIDSLDDPDLEELRIAVQNFGVPPQEALLQRGITSVEVRPGGFQRTETATPVVNAVVEGRIDVGIAWGPGAGWAASQLETDLELVPVTPAFDPPFLSMSFPMTMAVRTGDFALRDRLDRALAARWEEIQDVLAEYDVPVLDIAQPTVSPPTDGDVTRIGVVSPNTTGASAVHASLYDFVGDGARNGALLGEAFVNSDDGNDTEFVLYLASAPTAEAATRAAERLISTEDIDVFVGGVGEGQDTVLANLSDQFGIPFFNVGSTSEALRAMCHPYTLHVEASGSMYLDALVDWFQAPDVRTWFVVHEDTEVGNLLSDAADRAIGTFGDGSERVGGAEVVSGQPSYHLELEALRESGADVVMLLLDAPDQIAFMGQMSSLGVDVQVAPFPDPVTQNRDYLAVTRIRVGEPAFSERIALWEPTLEAHGAGEVNERYGSRFGVPMESSAFAAYQSIRMLDDAIAGLGSFDSDSVVTWLSSGDRDFPYVKGPGVSFRPGSRQLQQPLYVIEVDPDAQWSNTLSGMLGVASLVAELPAADEGTSPSEALGRYGRTAPELDCASP